MRTDRITIQHLPRTAIVYVRQSSPEQVRSHAESTRIQVGPRDKAVAFGWPKPVTIVDDLGISAAVRAQCGCLGAASLGPEPCCWNGDGCIGRQGLLGV
jgi:hypothetical protein